MTARLGTAIGYSLSVDLPPGYFELPLDDIDNRLDAAVPFVEQFSGNLPAVAVSEITSTLKVLLGLLVAGNTLYCGLGQHRADTCARVASWLTVSPMTYGEPQNPRLTLLGIAESKRTENPAAIVEPVDIEGKPVLFTEAVKSIPGPDVTGMELPEGARLRLSIGGGDTGPTAGAAGTP